MTVLTGSIPSPSSGVVHVGPLVIHLYGLTLLVAILLCVWLTTVRWRRLGGDSDLVLRVALWGVGFGVIGARAYHDITSWDEVPSPKWKGVFELWHGGLGVWGGILFGTIAGVIVVRRSLRSELRKLGVDLAAGDRMLSPRRGSEAELRAVSEDQRRLRARIEATRKLNVLQFMDAAAPGLLVAQGVGRIGNWWNQELYGKPTSLPWGLEIDSVHRPLQYLNSATFHPTFLYELLWDLAGAAILIWVGRRYRIRPPALFALYVAYYCFGRFFEELLRVDPSHHLAGLRLNAWVSIILCVAASGFFVWWQILGRGSDPNREHKAAKRPRPLPAGPKLAVPKGRVRKHG
jgi:prolipoprotein diacylglyceryl transferase